MNTLFSLEETSEFFMESFLSLLRKKPIHQISVRELCQKTGYNRSTFYYYFEDIYDLQRQVEKQLIDKIVSEISLQSCLTDEKFIKSLIAIYNTYGEIIIFLSRDSLFYESYKQALKPHLLEYLKVDKVTTELELTFEFIMGGIFSLLEKYVQEDTALNIEELTLFIQHQIDKLVTW